MISNRGFGKFEILTVIVLVLVIICVLSMTIFGGVSSQKLDTMKKSAIGFSSAVTTNISTFHNSENVYLQEIVDEKLLSPIKNPFGMGNCSGSESYVEIIDGEPFVTLKCNNILIEKENFSKKEVNAYKVSKWMEEKKKDDMEEKVLYNCGLDGGMKFNEYYDELYLVYMLNKEYGTSYYYLADVDKNHCLLETRTFYRTKELIK